MFGISSRASSSRRLTGLLALPILLCLSGCVAPSTDTAIVSAAKETAPAPADATTPPVPSRTVAQAAPVDESRAPPLDAKAAEPVADATASGAAVKLDTSCRTDADCTVKDVGNCCGYYPACVNVNSPTDPEGVKAACASSGMMSTCGFKEIQGCQCVAGSCQSNDDGGLQIQ